MTWFLFAAHGTPTILYLIQGKGVVVFRQNGSNTSRLVSISPEFVDRIKYEMDWMRAKGEEVMADLMLPPLQIVAAALNFCTLLLNSKHLFELPFKSMSAVTDTRTLMKNIQQSEPPPVTAQAPAAVRSPVAAQPPVVQQEEQRREHDNVQI
ncbi:MAG: hypothetical protein IIA17_03165 [candidate division Zixibacteria bacterium]|nr:hypothetical protein [candidate division Zixibacteria bacterium]